MNTPAVLFLVFNRPNQTKRSFDAIRSVKPRQLFVAADGPRAHRMGEHEKCAAVRDICQNVDWECEVTKLYRDANLGCKIAVSQAISWFFEHVESGIILEDDCLPDASFFRFCAELLERFKDDERIGCITGDNFQDGRTWGSTASYYFSKYPHIWGWATWRRAWQFYEVQLDFSRDGKPEDCITNFPTVRSEVKFWSELFNRVKDGHLDTWDHQLAFALWKRRLLTVTPNVNLVKNIGFGEDATHTNTTNYDTPNSGAIDFPLTHSHRVVQLVDADRYVHKTIFCPTFLYRLKRALRRSVN